MTEVLGTNSTLSEYEELSAQISTLVAQHRTYQQAVRSYELAIAAKKEQLYQLHDQASEERYRALEEKLLEEKQALCSGSHINEDGCEGLGLFLSHLSKTVTVTFPNEEYMLVVCPRHSTDYDESQLLEGTFPLLLSYHLERRGDCVVKQPVHVREEVFARFQILPLPNLNGELDWSKLK